MLGSAINGAASYEARQLGDLVSESIGLPIMVKIANLVGMKSVTALEAKTRFGEVLEAAQRQPISITRNGRPSVVVMSAQSFALRQRLARDRLQAAMSRAGELAAAQGMSEQALDHLLADES
jgi:prevent-host-death family protein